MAWVTFVPRIAVEAEPADMKQWWEYRKSPSLPKWTGVTAAVEARLRPHLNNSMHMCASYGYDIVERTDDIVAAILLLAFIEEHHPDYAPRFEDSAFLDTAEGRRAWAAVQVDSLLTAGAGRCNTIRQGWKRLDQLISEFPGTVNPSAAVTPEVLAMLVSHVQSTGRLEHQASAQPGRAWKGTGAKGWLKQLTAATQLLRRVPFSAEVIDHPMVKKAAQPPAATAASPTVSAHMALSIALTLADMARGVGLDDFPLAQQDIVRDYAQSFVICYLASARIIDMVRSEVKSFIPSSGGGEPALVLWCRGSKPKTMAQLRPFPLPVPNVGVDGKRIEWLAGWAQRRLLGGWKFVLPSVTIRRGNITRAEGAAAAADAVRVWELLLLRCPLRVSSDQARAMTLSGHCFRHLLPDISRVMGLPLEDRNELGRWDGAVSRPSGVAPPSREEQLAASRRKKSCANVYSSGAAAVARQCRIRHMVCQFIASCVGSRPWSAVVPLQLGVPPTFDFLAQSQSVAGGAPPAPDPPSLPAS